MKLTDLLQQLFTYLLAHGLHDLVAAIIIGAVGYRFASTLPRLLQRVMTKARVDPTLTTFVTNVSRYAIFIFVTIVVLGRLGIETASLVAVLGAAGLAIGLALQGSLLASFERWPIGFALGIGIGVLLAILTGLSRAGEIVADPILQALRSVPLLGLIPLFIVWFGIGQLPKVLFVMLSALFPVYLNTFAGIRGGPRVREAQEGERVAQGVVGVDPAESLG